MRWAGATDLEMLAKVKYLNQPSKTSTFFSILYYNPLLLYFYYYYYLR